MILLASSSPRRRRLLREAGIRFRVVRPPYEEKHDRALSPRRLTMKHALAKALSVRASDADILAADTLVWRAGRVIGKPKNPADARRILTDLQGKWHAVWTGVAWVRRRRGKTVRRTVFAEKTLVRLLPLTAADIRGYFRRVNPLDKAGAYAIQSKHSIVADVRGSRSNAVGLPMERLKKVWGASVSRT